MALIAQMMVYILVRRFPGYGCIEGESSELEREKRNDCRTQGANLVMAPVSPS